MPFRYGILQFLSPFPSNCILHFDTCPFPLALRAWFTLVYLLTQLSYSFSRVRYSLADNLAELVNLVEENLVVRHSSGEEVEEVDRTRRLYAPKGASKLCEFVIIRKMFRYASSLFSVGLGRRCAMLFRVVPCGIRGGVNVAAYRGFTAAFVLPPSSHALSLSSDSDQFVFLYAHVTHIHTYTCTQPWIIHPC